MRRHLLCILVLVLAGSEFSRRATLAAGENQYEKVRILAIGIRKYKDINNPKYADSDARLFVETFENSPMPVPIESKLLLNEEATLANIRSAMTELRVATDKELVIVYFAGHGVNDKGTPVLVPYDHMKADSEPAQYTLDALKSDLSRIRGAHKLLFLDCCYSGAFNFGRNIGYTPDMTVSADDLKTSDWVVFSSCRSNEESYAYDYMKQGFFTTALRYGLTGYADKDDDGWVSMQELTEFCTDYVRSLTRKMSKYNQKIHKEEGIMTQNPTLNAANLDLGFKVTKVLPKQERARLPKDNITIRIKVTEPDTARFRVFRRSGERDEIREPKGDFPHAKLWNPGLTVPPGELYELEIYDPYSEENVKNGYRNWNGSTRLYGMTYMRLIKFKPSENPPPAKMRLKEVYDPGRSTHTGRRNGASGGPKE